MHAPTLKHLTIAGLASAILIGLTATLAFGGRPTAISVSPDIGSSLPAPPTTADSAAVAQPSTADADIERTSIDDSTVPDRTPAPTDPTTTIDDLATSADDDEGIELGADAGVITSTGGKSTKPVRPEPTAGTPPAPTWSPVSLELVEPPAPAVVEPEPTTTDIPVLDGRSASGDKVGNTFGCAARCITSATLQYDHRSPDVDVRTTSNVDVTTAVWVLPSGPLVVDGVPAYVGRAPLASNSSAARDWSTTLSSLQHDTTYRIVVAVEDRQGNFEYASTLFTTVSAAPDELVANGSPCDHQCFTSVEVIRGAFYNLADIEAHTNADVEFAFAVSTSRPGTIDGQPLLPADEAVTIVNSGEFHERVRLATLEPDTTYHVVVKAIDSSGGVAHAAGQFHTDPAPAPRDPLPSTDYRVVFERVHIHDDGDPGRLNKGEISFGWHVGFGDDGDYWAETGVDRIGTGENVSLNALSTWVSVPAGSKMPPIRMRANESDVAYWKGGCQVGAIPDGPTFHEHCDMTVNVIDTGSLGIGWLDTLQPCSDFGLDLTERRCTVLESQRIGSDYVDFDLLISIEVA